MLLMSNSLIQCICCAAQTRVSCESLLSYRTSKKKRKAGWNLLIHIRSISHITCIFDMILSIWYIVRIFWETVDTLGLQVQLIILKTSHLSRCQQVSFNPPCDRINPKTDKWMDRPFWLWFRPVGNRNPQRPETGRIICWGKEVSLNMKVWLSLFLSFLLSLSLLSLYGILTAHSCISASPLLLFSKTAWHEWNQLKPEERQSKTQWMD